MTLNLSEVLPGGVPDQSDNLRTAADRMREFVEAADLRASTCSIRTVDPDRSPIGNVSAGNASPSSSPTRPNRRRAASNGPVPNLFAERNGPMSPGGEPMPNHIDHASMKVLRSVTRLPSEHEVIEVAASNWGERNQCTWDDINGVGRVHGHFKSIQNVENMRSKMVKIHDNREVDRTVPPVKEVWGHSSEASRKSSKDSSNRSGRRTASKGGTTVVSLSTSEMMSIAFVIFCTIVVVVALCIWSQEGLLASHDVGHIIEANTRAGHVHSPMFVTPVNISLSGTESQFFEVRLIAMATKDFSVHESHRRLTDRRLTDRSYRRPRLLSGEVTGTITYRLLADGEEFYTNTVDLRADEEIEHFKDVDVADKGKDGAKTYTAYVTSNMSDGSEAAFMCQVMRMSSGGRHRQLIGIVIFVVTFIGIVSEKIHRSYSAFLGASTTLCALAAIVETPHLHNITQMIDWGTLMLLFSMMILMRMLAVTGFFNWFAVRVVYYSKQNVKVLFFALTNICGILSMVLDNVTCVMLFGPLTFNLARKMKLNPRYMYLAMTICATVGGTGTRIGDPPNIVIGSKMQIGPEQFMYYNFPLTVFIMLPLSSLILYYRVKDTLLAGEQVILDIDALQKENPIVNEPMLAKLGVIIGGIVVMLILSPVHKIEPAWLTVMAMFGSAILFERHQLSKYLEFVEWDTLLFFALLFVLVESLSELGVIRLLGNGIIGMIEIFSEDSRMAWAIIIILWVSAIGSAFLESLPYTTTIVYILIDLQKRTIDGVRPEVLVWPLSVGACVGGIGSIMGSSANLVCMAVSERYGDKQEQKVQGGDFLRYGLPTMFIIVSFAMVWQLILFVACGAG